MNELRPILLRERENRPLMTVQDGFKLIYQNEFGSGHMVGDAQACLARLSREISELRGERAETITESIGNGLIRINLSRNMQVSARTVNAMFVDVANTRRGSVASLQEKAALLNELFAGAQEFLSGYDMESHSAVSHSEVYRRAYHPAYRLASELAATYWLFFAEVDKRLAEERKKPLIVAIDGMCASGKTTLGEYARRIYGANLFHMDDFFLPPSMKTPERLRQAGGNVHYERFLEEVQRPLLEGRAFSYRPYDCSTGKLSESVSVCPHRLNIVEGAYCMHPALDEAYDLRIALIVAPQEQSRRILVRNGERMHARFLAEWIPMENEYLKAYDILGRCDLVYRA